MDHNSKSFSGGFNKNKSFIYNPKNNSIISGQKKQTGHKDNTLESHAGNEVNFENIIDQQLNHLTTYKINCVKPMKIRFGRKGLKN